MNSSSHGVSALAIGTIHLSVHNSLNPPHGSNFLLNGYYFWPIEYHHISSGPTDAYVVAQGTRTSLFSPTPVTTVAVSEGQIIPANVATASEVRITPFFDEAGKSWQRWSGERSIFLFSHWAVPSSCSNGNSGKFVQLLGVFSWVEWIKWLMGIIWN